MKLNNKNKLLYSIFSLLLLGLLASALVAYLYISNTQRQALKNEHLVKARAATTKLAHWFDKNLSLVDHYARYIASHPDGLRNNARLQNYLRQSVATGRFHFISYSLESDGYMWINDWMIPKDFDPRTRPWYIHSKQAMKPVIPEPYLSIESVPKRYLAITAPIMQQQKFTGMVLGDVPLEFVEDTVLDIHLGFDGQVFIVNQDNRILVHQNSRLEELQLNTVLGNPTGSQEPMGNDSALSIEETASHIYTQAPIGDTGWNLIMAQNKSIIRQNLVRSTVNLLSAFVGIFLMVLTLLFISNRRIFSPLLNVLEQDANTGLANKRTFKEHISQHYLNNQIPGMLVIINVNNFNLLTAALPGQSISLLQNEIKRRIETSLPPETQLGIFSENRFIAYLPNHANLEQREQLFRLQRLAETLDHYYSIQDQQLTCTFRQGVSFYPQHGDHIEQLIDRAFSVMGNAKKHASSQNIQVYSPAIDQQLSKDLRVFSAIHNGLRNHEFELAFQPQYDLHKQCFSGIEVLLRWYSGELQRQVPPAEFIPIAESSQLIIQLGDFVINETLRQISQWRSNRLYFDQVSINVSPKQLQQHNFTDKLLGALKRYQVNATQIELEITETLLFDEPEHCIELLQELKNAGFSLAIDDFGTGYSSLQYLKLLPVDKLKVDRAFIKDLPGSYEDQIIIKMITEMSQALGFTTLAEGAETAQQIEALRHAGYDMVQGYYYARPMSALQLHDFMLGSTAVTQ